MTVLAWLLVLSSPARTFEVRCDRLKAFYSRRSWPVQGDATEPKP